MDTIYQIVAYAYWVIVFYFAFMMFWKLVTEKRLHMQVAIAIAIIPFIYRLLGVK